MDEDNLFLTLVRRVRAGDGMAAAELVRLYEPAVRRVVRMRLRDPRLRRILDSTDVCQSVMASFFVRVAAGQFELSRPEQLLRLLSVMARNKLAGQARRGYVTRREVGGDDTPPGSRLADPGPGPNQQVAWRDLLGAVRGRLSDEERQLADRRGGLQGWEQIAAELGGTPDGLRKKLTRALDRVARQLGLDDPDYG
jgi:RNA polymerase sigma-70 factor (ECF subfamily)